MAESQHPSPSPRLAYLESIRGLAAMQVLLLHCFSAFAPALVFPPATDANVGTAIHLSPLFFVYDGFSAVYIFFVLSGLVLTGAFARQLAHPFAVVAGRAIRLGIPALTATLAAAAIMALFGRPNVEAGHILGSNWFATLWNPELSLWSAVRDGLLNALLLGYRDMPGVAFLAPWQQSGAQSFAVPLWTLSIEFYGSLLILGLCLIRRQSKSLWWIAMLLGAIFYVRSAYICFFAGHLLATLSHPDHRPARRIWPALAVILGVACCVLSETWQPAWLHDFCRLSTPLLFPDQSAQFMQKAFGAICILCGVLNWPAARVALSKRWLANLSRLSFPLYLVHWPILFGPTAAFFLLIAPRLGTTVASALSIVLAIMLSLAASLAFVRVDDIALTLSRRFRKLRAVPLPSGTGDRLQPAE